MFACGVDGLIWTMQAAAPQMARRGGGSIINLSSVSASHPAKNSIAYSALKASVVGLTRAAAMELSPKQICVNAIAPGMIGTPADRRAARQLAFVAIPARRRGLRRLR